MGIVFKNNAKTTLASSLSNSATSATVTDGSVFPSLSAGEFFLVTFDDGTNNEICKCTARSGNTLTIVRAQESTTARAFSSGDSAEGRVTAGVLETIQENIAAKSANQTVFNTTTAGGATTYDIGTNPGVEANAMVFLNGVLQHHDTLSFSGSNLTFDAAPPNGMALEVIIDNLINLQSSNLTVDTFTAADIAGTNIPQTDFVLSDTPAAETNLIVFVDGVFQDQDSYTISSNTLTITDGVIDGRGVTVYVINPVNIGTPSDGTVTSAKLSGNITMPGTLTVGSNDVAFDSPTFVVDNANSRVGLGTASPSVPVDIVGDVKMSADLTVDTSTLKVDSSNNRVGIGTTSPLRTLHVNSGSTNVVARFESTDNIGAIELKDNGGSAEIGCNNNDLVFFPAGAEKARLTSGGNFGIGVTNPNTIFEVGSNQPNIRLRDTDNNHYARIGGSAGDLILEADGGDGQSNSKMTFMVDGNDKLKLDANGSLELGHGGAAFQRADGQAFSIITPANGGGQGIALKRLDSNNDQGLGEITWSNNTADGLTTIMSKTQSATNTTILRIFCNSAGTERQVVEISPIGSAGDANLQVTNHLSNAFNHVQENLVPNMTSGENVFLGVGKENNSKNTGYVGYYWSSNAHNDNFIHLSHWGSDNLFRVYGNGQISSNSIYSDRDKKENIKEVSGTSLDKIVQVPIKSFRMKQIGANTTEIRPQKTGFIAQEVQPYLPDVVSGTDGEGDMGIDTVGIIAHLVRAVKEQQVIIDDLKARIETLEG